MSSESPGQVRVSGEGHSHRNKNSFSVFMFGLQLSNALKPSFFGKHVHLRNTYTKFICQGHLVNVKMTGANKRVCVPRSQVVCLRLEGNLVTDHFLSTNINSISIS